MWEALDKQHFLSKAFFNEKVCSLTIRKADKSSVWTVTYFNKLLFEQTSSHLIERLNESSKNKTHNINN